MPATTEKDSAHCPKLPPTTITKAPLPSQAEPEARKSSSSNSDPKKSSHGGSHHSSSRSKSKSLDKSAFVCRLTRVYSHWIADSHGEPDASKPFRDLDGIVILIGNYSPQDDESVARAFGLWLYGCELSSTITVFSKSQVLILSGNKKLEYLRQVITYLFFPLS